LYYGLAINPWEFTSTVLGLITSMLVLEHPFINLKIPETPESYNPKRLIPLLPNQWGVSIEKNKRIEM